MIMSDISARSTDEILRPSASYGSTVWSSQGSISTRQESYQHNGDSKMQRLREFIKKLRGKNESSATNNNNGSTAQLPVNKLVAKSGPSSVKTVLIVAGLMCVGFILFTSGIILVTTDNNRNYPSFLITGSVFICLGVVFFIICLIVQKKNFLKHVERLEKDLYH